MRPDLKEVPPSDWLNLGARGPRNPVWCTQEEQGMGPVGGQPVQAIYAVFCFRIMRGNVQIFVVKAGHDRAENHCDTGKSSGGAA